MADMLRIGDRPEVKTLDCYGGGSYTLDSSFNPGKVKLISFVDINNGWDWIYYLLKLRAEPELSNLVIVIVAFRKGLGVASGNLNDKFPFPTGSGTEKRFSRADLTPTDPAAAGLYVLMDSDWTYASKYLDGFSSIMCNDPSFDGSYTGTKTWSYIISPDFYITDKWETNTTLSNFPISFSRFSLYTTTFTPVGTFGNPSRARMSLDGIGLAGNYITIDYDGTVYTYTVNCTGAMSVFPVNNTISSKLEPVTIQFNADTPAAASKANYGLTVESGTITSLDISSPQYLKSFDSSIYGVAQRYLKKRIDNLLLPVPEILNFIPQPETIITSLPGMKMDIVFSKPVGKIDASAPLSRLLVDNIKSAINYDLYQANGLTLSEIKYENSGTKIADVENVGKIENVVTLKFTGSFADSGPLGVKINENAPADQKISDTAGTLLAGNDGNPYYTADYIIDITPPTISAFSLSGTGPVSDPAIKFNLSATDNTKINAYKIDESSSDPASWTDVEPAVSSLSVSNSDYTITGGAGLRTIYAHVRDIAGNISHASFTVTLDQTEPSWASGWPKCDTITDAAFTAKAKTNESGKAYYLVLADGTASPTSEQVKTGGGIKSGNFVLAANTESSHVVNGLSAKTSYDVWFAADDAAGNLQSAPVKRDITTNGANLVVSGGSPVQTIHTDDTIVFGDVVCNKTKDMSFSVTNTGSSDLVVSGITISNIAGGCFSLTGMPSLPFTVTPGGAAVSFTVRLAPVMMSSYSADITVVSNDPASSGFHFRVGGMGIPAIGVRALEDNWGHSYNQPVYYNDEFNMGNCYYTQDTILELSITNSGSNPLTVTALTMSGDPTLDLCVYPFPSLPAVIPPGGSLATGISFAPDQVNKDYMSDFHIICNDASCDNDFVFYVRARSVHQGVGQNRKFHLYVLSDNAGHSYNMQVNKGDRFNAGAVRISSKLVVDMELRNPSGNLYPINDMAIYNVPDNFRPHVSGRKPDVFPVLLNEHNTGLAPQQERELIDRLNQILGTEKFIFGEKTDPFHIEKRIRPGGLTHTLPYRFSLVFKPALEKTCHALLIINRLTDRPKVFYCIFEGKGTRRIILPVDGFPWRERPVKTGPSGHIKKDAVTGGKEVPAKSSKSAVKSKTGTVEKPEAKPKPAAKKAAVKKPVVKKAVSKKATVKAAVKKTAVKKASVGEPVVKKVAVRKAAVKKAVVKKPAVRKATAKKAAVKKPVVKKAAVKKVAVKKAAVKKTVKKPQDKKK